MKKIFLPIITLIALSATAFSQVSIMWTSRYTGAGANVDRAADIALDAAGNVYVTGAGWDTVNSNYNYVTVKYDSNGNQVWVKEYNGPGNGLDEARAIAVDSATGNVYVTGWSYTSVAKSWDYVTIMYNSAGVEQWATAYDNNSGFDEAYDIAVDTSGNAYVTGGSAANASGTGTGTDYATVKYNNLGVQQWATRYTNLASANMDVAYAITLDASNNIYVTGSSKRISAAPNDFDYATIKYNNSGIQQWVSIYNNTARDGDDEAHAIAVDDATGNVYVSGWSRGPGIGINNFDYATLMIDNTGAQQWVSRYDSGDLDNDRVFDLAIDGTGNAYVTGRSKKNSSAEDIATLKYNNTGAQQWLVRYNSGGVNYDEGKSITLDAAGNVFVTGYSYSSATNNDYVTIKYSNAGTQQWLTKYNGTGNNTDQAAALWVDALNNVFITGVSKGSTTLEDYTTIKYCQMQTTATNDTAICIGQSVQLAASATGSTGYVWNPATGLSSATIANPVCSATVTTTYVVTAANASGCVDGDTVIVTVNPLPVLVITPSGPTSFCAGGSVYLSASGYASYSWVPASSTNDTILVSTSGTHTLTVIDFNGCTGSNSQSVTVNPLPTIDAGANTGTCGSAGAVLNATGGTTWSWTPSSTLNNSTIANPVATPTVFTTYTVVGTDANGCSGTDYVSVNIYPSAPSPFIVQVSWSDFQANPAGTTYQWWYYNGAPIPGATNRIYTPAAYDTIVVQVCDANGCCAFSPYIIVTGIETIDFSSQVTVFPNPSNGIFSINTNLNLKNAKVEVSDVIGRIIYTSEITSSQSEINLSGQSKGIYFLKMTFDKGVVKKKIIIQ